MVDRLRSTFIDDLLDDSGIFPAIRDIDTAIQQADARATELLERTYGMD